MPSRHWVSTRCPLHSLSWARGAGEGSGHLAGSQMGSVPGQEAAWSGLFKFQDAVLSHCPGRQRLRKGRSVQRKGARPLPSPPLQSPQKSGEAPGQRPPQEDPVLTLPEAPRSSCPGKLAQG